MYSKPRPAIGRQALDNSELLKLHRSAKTNFGQARLEDESFYNNSCRARLRNPVARASSLQTALAWSGDSTRSAKPRERYAKNGKFVPVGVLSGNSRFTLGTERTILFVRPPANQPALGLTHARCCGSAGAVPTASELQVASLYGTSAAYTLQCEIKR